MNAHGMALVAGALLAMSGGVEVAAQSAATGDGAGQEATRQEAVHERRGPRMTVNPELIMSLRERLELTDDQLAALETLRNERVQHRTATQARMEELRSRLRAGEIERSEMRAYLEELREARPDAADERARIEGILTEDQIQSLGEMRRRGARAMGQRGDVRRGSRQMRARRGAVRGGRGAAVRGGRGAAVRGGRGAAQWRSGARWQRENVRGWRVEMRGMRRGRR